MLSTWSSLNESSYMFIEIERYSDEKVDSFLGFAGVSTTNAFLLLNLGGGRVVVVFALYLSFSSAKVLKLIFQ